MKKCIAILTILLLAACTAAQPDVETPAETVVPSSTHVPTATRVISPTPTYRATSTKRPTATMLPNDSTWIRVNDKNWEAFSPWEPTYKGDRGVLSLIPKGGLYLWRADDRLGIYQDGELTVFDIEDSGLSESPYHHNFSTEGGALIVLGYEELAVFRDGEWEMFPTPPFPDEFTGYRLIIDPSGSYWIGFDIEDQPNELRRFEGPLWKETILVDFDLSTLKWSPGGTLWGMYINTIMKYENGEWKEFLGEDLWVDYLTGLWHENISMTVSDSGNVYLTHTSQDSIVKIDPAGNITEIPLSTSVFFDYWANNIFILEDEEIWIYCATEKAFGYDYILGYYVPDPEGGDGEWYFIDQHLSFVRKIIEQPDGSFLIDTWGGMYIYTPEE